ncbi:MAG: CotH kinase family protein, partial [Bacteroidota bacterium]
MIRVYLTLLILSNLYLLNGQYLPTEMYISDDNHLITGGNEVKGLYDLSTVHKLELSFTEPNWFTLLDEGNGSFAVDPISLYATLTFNDEFVLDSILVNIKGVTSDFLNNTFKKSFSLDLDFIKDQDLMGYDNLNLNCGFLDESSMREILYYDISKGFVPALKGAFVDLYINGEYWGPYSNIQQIEGTYLSEWFINNNGTRWRAISPNGFPTNGSVFGEGESTLNYNGASPSDYTSSYTLKKTDVVNPWAALVNVCDQLNNLPTSLLYDELKYHLDVDKVLWFLAQENIFMDDDSYIFKGGMDYYVYW